MPETLYRYPSDLQLEAPAGGRKGSQLPVAPRQEHLCPLMAKQPGELSLSLQTCHLTGIHPPGLGRQFIWVWDFPGGGWIPEKR